VFFDIDRTFDPAQLPQGGAFPLVGQGQLAARVDDPTDDHGQAILYPRLVARVECLVQSQLLGQLQESAAGSVFSGVDRLKGLGRILGNDVAAEGGLNEFELIEGQAGDAAVVGVLDFVALAEGGAQDPDRIGAVSLDFEMNGSVWFQDGYT
jgi:hypothetical protein